ncbi:DeoR/GlpR transcriptional regulator [Rhodovulum sp. 12E13]|uniref:DeoR/GlpR family DNA-binding transcription regulator n=1 Tax=Rhodovulum sp. 12E13 TaxID=2203891 RepID=UPI000E19D3DD|nr:DeoR/GlpR family DNA-binding transcription regulator [Rhodovulum sp. 12E13]RDC72569.1 DeoR/GlpR transcriptional regulator [Rhodovulum sp. 12E13]
MDETALAEDEALHPRLRKDGRRAQIVLELRLRPHVRVGELARRFGVQAETGRRDVEALSAQGVVSRAHGGATTPAHGRRPGLDERSAAPVAERERIGRRAGELVRPGETVMVDSGSTTLQFARFLACRGTPCTVMTNSLPIAMMPGHADVDVDVILFPGDYLPDKAATVGTEAVDFLERHRTDRCMTGASGLSAHGPVEAMRGLVAIKRAMIRRCGAAHLLVDSEKVDRPGPARVAPPSEPGKAAVNARPVAARRAALDRAVVGILPAEGADR